MRGNNTQRSAVPAQSAQQAKREPKINKRPVFSPKEASRRILRGTLPPNSLITGSLFFKDDRNPIFSPNTRILGNLRLLGCGSGTRLAETMTIEGCADFSMTPFTFLPTRFSAKISLDMDPGMLIQMDRNATHAMKARAEALKRSTRPGVK